MITLKQEVVDRIKKSQELKFDMQGALKVSHTTLYKYLKKNDAKLANINAITMLVKKHGFKKSEILTQ